jgi:serine protease Do
MNLKVKAIVSSLVVAGFVGGLAVGHISNDHFGVVHARSIIDSDAPAITTPVPATSAAVRGLPDFTGLVQQYGAAVVNITVTKNMQPANAQIPGMDRNNPFQDFFRHFQIPGPQGGAPRGGIGSGFIVSPDGTILTNAHVVAGADEVTVKLNDRREFKAKVVGSDPQTDVAVLKIDAKNLPVVKLGNPQNLRVGEWVVAIGSPFGFENTVTSGIVSAKARALPDGTYVPFIQTDVAVNPGNSGGPLFNMNGEVIGINSQIYSGTGGYQGLSFAIPIDVAVNVKDQLVHTGKVTRGRIGVVVQDVNQSLAESFGMKRPGGALISQVERGSPAEKAGLQPGDVVLKVDDQPVNRTLDLSGYIANLKPGASATLEVWRKGSARTIAVTTGEMQSTKVASANGANASGGRLGVAVRELTPDEQKQVNAQGGLLVEDVSGPAARAGIQPGDVVLSANGTPVKNVGDLRSQVEKSKGHVALLVQRDDARIFIPVELG